MCAADISFRFVSEMIFQTKEIIMSKKITEQCPKCGCTKLIYGEDSIENVELRDNGTRYYCLDWRCLICKANGLYIYRMELETIAVVDK